MGQTRQAPRALATVLASAGLVAGFVAVVPTGALGSGAVGLPAPAAGSPARACHPGRGIICGVRNVSPGAAAAALVAATTSAQARRELRLASASRLFGRRAASLLHRSDAALRRGLQAKPKARAAGVSGTNTVARSEGGGLLRELAISESVARQGRSMQQRKFRLESAVETCPDPTPGNSHGKAKLRGVAVYDVLTRVVSGRRTITTSAILRLNLAEMPALVNRRAKFDGILGPPDRMTITSTQTVTDRRGTHESPSSTIGMTLDSMSPGTEVKYDAESFDAWVERSEARDNGEPNPYADSPTAGAAYKRLARAFADMVGARVVALVKDAEKIWQTPGRCVTLTLTGSPNRLRPGAKSQISGAVTPSRAGVTETSLLDLATFDADYIDPRGSAVTVATLPLKPGVPWFDFTAPAAAWAKTEAPGLDVTFYSKGGIGRAPITYPSGFPGRFTGTWTRVLTDSNIRLGWKQTVQGTATFVRNPVIPGIAEGLIAVPYDLESGSVTWTVTGSRQDGSCTTTYSGAGNDAVSKPSAIEFTGFTLEDVSAKTTTTTPFYYSVRATGERLMPPLFTITSAGGVGCASTTQEPIVAFFLDIGSVADFSSATPPDRIEQSGDITLLAGHRARSDPGELATDDTWSFKGTD